MDTSKPYTRAMRDIVHEPQANLGEDQKFSLVDVFKWKEGDKPWIFNGLIKRQMTPLPSLQNGQVFKSNRIYTLREFPERFAKDRMRLQELSPLSKGQSICVFQKKKILNQNQNLKIGKECHEHCTTFHYITLFHMKPAFTKISRQRLHASASPKIMLTA